MRKKKEFKKKEFHPRRQIRISDEVLDNLKEIKRGTWNYFLRTLLDSYKKYNK